MVNRAWDAVVVGGGLVGSSVAYHLARAGVRTLLIEQGDLASGASGANFGRVQLLDAELGFSLELSLQAAACFPQLEAELGCNLEYQPSPYLLLIENERQWAAMERRAAALRAAGVEVDLLGQDDVCRLEPQMAPDTVIGALYHADEARLNPFLLVWAYVRRGREWGLEVWPYTRVTGVETQGARVTGVRTPEGKVPARWVILATGAWTRELGRTAGLDLPANWSHGQAIVAEPLLPITCNGMLTSGFFEGAHSEGQQDETVGFCMSPSRAHLIIGEAVRFTDRLDRRNTATGLPAIAAEAQRRFPVLRRAAVLRGWAIPVAFTSDNRPLLGPVNSLDGLLIAAALKSTVILTPLVGKWITALVAGGTLDDRFAEFSPMRFGRTTSQRRVGSD